MRLNKYLASTLFTGLFITAGFLSPATAQEQSLQPQGAWAITKIDRSSEGGNSYCTLSRKYDDGVVLSLGRNATEEYSLAIDFQKPVFEKDKSLKINLQPGPGQIRAYDMMPTSEKAVVIRLGWDTGFFDSLNQSQQMKVKISDKAYSFAMPEITKGQGDLQECMEGLKTAGKKGDDKSAAADTKDVLNAEAGKASGEFEAGKTAASVTASVESQEKGLLASFADSIKAQEPKLGNDEAPSKRSNFNSKTAKKDSADARPEPVNVADAKADVPPPELIRRPPPSDKVLPEAGASKAQDNTAQKLAMTAPAAQEALPPVAPAPVKAEPKVETKKEQKQDSKQDKVAAKAAAEKDAAEEKAVADAEKELAKLQAEKQMLQQRLDAAKAQQEKMGKPEEIAAAKARADELAIKNKQLEDSLRQSQVRIAETAVNTESKALRKIADLEVKLAAAQKDNADLAKQLDSFKLQQEDGRLSVVAGDWNLENATKRFNEAEREIRRLGLQLEQERTSCNREKASIEQMLFDPAVADSAQIQRLTKLEDDLDAANAKLADQSKAIQDAVNAQLATKTQTLEAEKAAAAAQVASLQKSLADREASIAMLQKDSAASQTAVAEKAQLTQQIAELQKTLAAKDAGVSTQTAAMQAQITTLQSTLTAKDQELAAFKGKPNTDQQVAALSTQVKTLTDTLAAKDKALADAIAVPKADPKMGDHIAALEKSQAALKAEADALRDQNIILRADSEKLRIQLADVIGNSSSRTDQVASMQLEMDTMRRQLQTKDTQLATYQNQIAVLQNDSAQLKNRLTVADDKGNSNTDEVSSLTRQVQQLQKQISDMDRRQQSSVSAAPVAMPVPAPIPTPILRERSVSAETLDKVTPAAGTSVYTQPTEAKAANYDAGNINSLLQKAGIGNNGVQKAGGGFSGADNFSWTDSSNVRGLASVKSLGSVSFDTMVDQYIGYQRGQCGGGDFASMPSPTNGSATKRMALYEIACVKGGENTASSLIFFEDQGRFIAISNQIGAADMDIAMDSRDKIAGFVRGL